MSVGPMGGTDQVRFFQNNCGGSGIGFLSDAGMNRPMHQVRILQFEQCIFKFADQLQQEEHPEMIDLFDFSKIGC